MGATWKMGVGHGEQNFLGTPTFLPGVPSVLFWFVRSEMQWPMLFHVFSAGSLFCFFWQATGITSVAAITWCFALFFPLTDGINSGLDCPADVHSGHWLPSLACAQTPASRRVAYLCTTCGSMLACSAAISVPLSVCHLLFFLVHCMYFFALAEARRTLPKCHCRQFLLNFL